MKRAPILAGMLVVLAVLATSAFTHPLASRNGVVDSYSPGKSLTIQTGGVDMTYSLRGNMFANVNGLGTGARVTVWAQCFGGQNSSSVETQQGLTASAKSSNTSTGTVVEGNPNTCIAVFILVRSAATGTAPTGGSSGGGSGGTAGGTAMPAVTATPTP